MEGQAWPAGEKSRLGGRLGAGGGADVLQAVYHQAGQIDAVELNPQFVELVAREHADFAGGLYARPEVSVHAAEARGFVARSKERWEIVQVPLLDSAGATTAMLLAWHRRRRQDRSPQAH